MSYSWHTYIHFLLQSFYKSKTRLGAVLFNVADEFLTGPKSCFKMTLKCSFPWLITYTNCLLPAFLKYILDTGKKMTL